MRISRQQAIIPPSSVSNKIHLVRETRVMLGADLAILYGIGTSHLNQAVSRNRARFPDDFRFRWTPQETRALISQSGIAKPAGRGEIRDRFQRHQADARAGCKAKIGDWISRYSEAVKSDVE
jgi:hypothetical protein